MSDAIKIELRITAADGSVHGGHIESDEASARDHLMDLAIGAAHYIDTGGLKRVLPIIGPGES